MRKLLFAAALLSALSAFPGPNEKATNDSKVLPPIGTLALPKTGVSVVVSIPAIAAPRLFSEAKVFGASMGPSGPTVRVSVFSKEHRLVSKGEEECFESRLREVEPGDPCTVRVLIPAVPNQADEFTIVITPLDRAPREISVSVVAFDPYE